MGVNLRISSRGSSISEKFLKIASVVQKQKWLCKKCRIKTPRECHPKNISSFSYYNQKDFQSLKKWDAFMQTLIYILGITILIIIPFPGIHLPMRWWENVQPGKGTIALLAGTFLTGDARQGLLFSCVLCFSDAIITRGSG